MKELIDNTNLQILTKQECKKIDGGGLFLLGFILGMTIAILGLNP